MFWRKSQKLENTGKCCYNWRDEYEPTWRVQLKCLSSICFSSSIFKHLDTDPKNTRTAENFILNSELPFTEQQDTVIHQTYTKELSLTCIYIPPHRYSIPFRKQIIKPKLHSKSCVCRCTVCHSDIFVKYWPSQKY